MKEKLNVKSRLKFYGLVAVIAMFNVKLALMLLFLTELAILTVVAMFGLVMLAKYVKSVFSYIRFRMTKYTVASTPVVALITQG